MVGRSSFSGSGSTNCLDSPALVHIGGGDPSRPGRRVVRARAKKAGSRARQESRGEVHFKDSWARSRGWPTEKSKGQTDRLWQEARARLWEAPAGPSFPSSHPAGPAKKYSVLGWNCVIALAERGIGLEPKFPSQRPRYGMEGRGPATLKGIRHLASAGQAPVYGVLSGFWARARQKAGLPVASRAGWGSHTPSAWGMGNFLDKAD